MTAREGARPSAYLYIICITKPYRTTAKRERMKCYLYASYAAEVKCCTRVCKDDAEAISLLQVLNYFTGTAMDVSKRDHRASCGWRTIATITAERELEVKQ